MKIHFQAVPCLKFTGGGWRGVVLESFNGVVNELLCCDALSVQQPAWEEEVELPCRTVVLQVRALTLLFPAFKASGQSLLLLYHPNPQPTQFACLFWGGGNSVGVFVHKFFLSEPSSLKTLYSTCTELTLRTYTSGMISLLV
jgi:hypothetical protein